MLNLSVAIPCFNEKETILDLVKAVKNSSYPVYEILIVDDDSNDGTRDLLRNHFSEDTLIKLIFHNKNMGKGAALKTAISEAAGDVFIIQDADLEYDPKEYAKLIRPIEEDLADVVYGSRFAGGQAHRVLYFWHMIGNKFLTFLSNAFTNLNLTDMETCYKVFKIDVIKGLNLYEKRFGIEPEITAKISKLKLRIYEVGISYYGRTYAQGKKIGWKDGLRAVYCILRYNIFK